MLFKQALILAAVAHTHGRVVELDSVATHGTGTPLGDPIETGAIGSALGNLGGAGRRRLALSSVKATYGHTEGAAGK